MRKIVNRNINKRNKNNKELYNKNVYGQDLVVGDRVLMKNVSEMGGTGKLRNFGDNKIYKAISVCKDLPIYEIQPEKNVSKIKTVHHNLLLLCNQLPSEMSPRKNALYKGPQPPAISFNDSELVYICRRNINDNTLDNNVEAEPESETADSSTGGNTDSSMKIVEERPQRVRKPPKLLTYSQLENPSYTNTALI